MLKMDLIKDILLYALKYGGDFAEIFMEDVDATGMTMIDNKMERMNIGRSRGMGIRIYDGLNSVYTFTNDTTRHSLIEMASNASRSLRTANKLQNIDINLKETKVKDLHDVEINPSDVDIHKRIKLLRDLSKASYSYSNEIKQCITSLTYSNQKILIANSDGMIKNDRRIRTRLSIEAIAQNNLDKQSGFESVGRLMGYEMIDKDVDIEQLAITASKSAIKSLNADYCKGGKMPVVIESGFGGVIFHEACGHSLEATAVAKNQSVFAGKIGEKIANECVSASDNGLITNSWGSLNIDDEGKEAANNLLIENGILKGYMIDRLNARRMKMDTTASARRQSYKYAPTSRMTNTYIHAGKDKKESMIASIDNGIYAVKMGGGSVNPMTGEFNFAVNEAYLIKDGKLDKALKGASLIGRGEEILKNITMVSDNLELASGMCGSLSGSIPVCVGQPTIKVSSITVGGK